MEDDPNFFENGRRPQYFFNGRQPKVFGKLKMTSICSKWKTTLFFQKWKKNYKKFRWKTTYIFSKIEDNLIFIQKLKMMMYFETLQRVGSALLIFAVLFIQDMNNLWQHSHLPEQVLITLIWSPVTQGSLQSEIVHCVTSYYNNYRNMRCTQKVNMNRHENVVRLPGSDPQFLWISAIVILILKF